MPYNVVRFLIKAELKLLHILVILIYFFTIGIGSYRGSVHMHTATLLTNVQDLVFICVLNQTNRNEYFLSRRFLLKYCGCDGRSSGNRFMLIFTPPLAAQSRVLFDQSLPILGVTDPIHNWIV